MMCQRDCLPCVRHNEEMSTTTGESIKTAPEIFFKKKEEEKARRLRLLQIEW